MPWSLSTLRNGLKEGRKAAGLGMGANACASFKHAGEASQSFPGSDVNLLLHPMVRTKPGMMGVMKVVREL